MWKYFQVVVVLWGIAVPCFAPPLPFYVPEYIVPFLGNRYFVDPIPLNESVRDQAELVIRNELNRTLGGTGKRVRPLLVYLAAGLIGLSPSEALEIARIAEFVHNASLVHDDIIDKDLVRRGQPTTLSEFGDGRAVLIGDYFLAELTEMAIKSLPTKEMVAELMRVIKGMTIGEEIQAAALKRGTFTLEEYRDIIVHKTGLLFAWPMTSTTTLIDGDHTATRQRFQDFALALGELYQMWDDLDPKDYKKKEVNIVRFYAAQASLISGASPIRTNFRDKTLEAAREKAIERLKTLATKIQDELIEALVTDTDKFIRTAHYRTRRNQCIKSARAMVDFLSTPPPLAK